MTPINDLDIESELSYAYLHAVAAHARASCQTASRIPDNRGIDAQLTCWGPYVNGGILKEVDLKIQLKATTATSPETATHISYNLKEISQYDALRMESYAAPRILVVLFLPLGHANWVEASPEQLVMKRCAYWVSLVGAPESANSSSQTVYLPKSQLLTSAALMELFSQLSRGETPRYEPPRST
jgi:hypothetical protein